MFKITMMIMLIIIMITLVVTMMIQVTGIMLITCNLELCKMQFNRARFSARARLLEGELALTHIVKYLTHD